MKYFESGCFKYSLMAAVAVGGLALGAGGASAMPNGLPSAPSAAPSGVENVRWVCGPYRCSWQPGWGPAPYGVYGPRPWGWGWHRGWGWRRGWHRW
jgi:hypothetical protein